MAWFKKKKKKHLLAKQEAWGSLAVAIVFQIVCTYFIPMTIGTVIPVHTDSMSAFDVGGSQRDSIRSADFVLLPMPTGKEVLDTMVDRICLEKKCLQFRD